MTYNNQYLLKPQRQNEAAFQGVQQQFDAFSRSAAEQRDERTTEGIRPTGRGASFMNLSHYYPSRTGGAGRAGGSAPGPVGRH